MELLEVPVFEGVLEGMNEVEGVCVPCDLVGVILAVLEGVCVGEGVPVTEGVLDGVGEKPPGGALHVRPAPEPEDTNPGRHSHLAPVMSTPSAMNVEFAAEQIHDPFSNVGAEPTGHDLQVAELSLS